MHVMHELKEHVANRFRSTQDPNDERRSRAAEARSGAADTFSVRRLAAHEHGRHVAVLSVRGEIDLVTAPVLREALLPVLEHGTGAVVVDLSEVPFMDSAGVHALVDTVQRLRSQGRRLAIACREHGQVHRLLALVGLLDAVAVHGSLRGAVTGGEDRVHPASTRTSISPQRQKRTSGTRSSTTTPRAPGG